MNNAIGPSHQHRAECDCPALSGGDCIWPGCERECGNEAQVIAWALKSCTGVYHGFYNSFHEASAQLSNYEKSLKMRIVEVIEKQE